MNAIIQMAGGVALLLWGAYMVKTGMLRTFGLSLKDFLSLHLHNRFAGAGSGTLLACLLQSSTAATLIIAGMQAEGVINTAIALAAIMGADFGSALMTRILSFDLSALSPIFILAGALFFFIRKPATRAGQFGRILIGLGIVMLALKLIIASTMPLRNSPELAPIFAQISEMPAAALLMGLALGFGCFSSLAAVVITSGLVTSGVIPVSIGLWAALGADFESTTLALLTTATVSRAGRSGPIANAMWRYFALCVIGLLLAFVPQIPELFSKIPDSVIYFHVTINLVMCSIGLFFIKPLARAAERLLKIGSPAPQTEAQTLLSKEAKVTPSVSLQNANRRMLDILNAAKGVWRDFATMLKRNPAEGEILLIRDANRRVISDCRELSGFLNSAMPKEDLDKTVRHWQLVKDTCTAIESTSRIMKPLLKSLAAQKCARNLSFSPEGLSELMQHHQRVSVCLDYLSDILSSARKNPEQASRTALALLNKSERMFAESYELTRSHLDRVGQGNPVSLDTNAMHLDLLTVFNRITGVLASAATSFRPVIQTDEDVLDDDAEPQPQAG